MASSFPRVDADIKIYDDEVTAMRAKFNQMPPAPSDLVWVKSKLQNMVDVDQVMRRYTDTPFAHQYSAAEKEEFWKQFGSRFSQLDREDTAELKTLLKLYPWFTISRFGAQADRNAWLLVQHADLDPAFQQSVLAILTELWPKGETSPANYAYLFDRVANSPAFPSQRKLQRYGTQGHCIGPGKWEPWPIEDPAHLDERRASVGLGTEADYILVFRDICRGFAN